MGLEEETHTSPVRRKGSFALPVGPKGERSHTPSKSSSKSKNRTLQAIDDAQQGLHSLLNPPSEDEHSYIITQSGSIRSQARNRVAGPAALTSTTGNGKATRHTLSGPPATAGSLTDGKHQPAGTALAALRSLDQLEGVEARLDQAVGEVLALAEAATDVAELAAWTAERCDGTFRADAICAALLAEAAACGAAVLVAGTLTVTERDERLGRARRLADLSSEALRRALEAGP